MSKLICASAIDGAIAWVVRAEERLEQAIRAEGRERSIGFPETAYYLPVIHSFTGERAETLGDLRDLLTRAKGWLPARPSEEVWLPYLGNALDAGVVALFACEIIEACNYLSGPDPADGIWLGAASDVIMRERGIEFVDGTAPGFAAITGAAPSNEIAVQIARQLQEKNLYVFMAGCSNGKQFAEQLAEEGVQLGWETRLVPFGREVSSLIYALGFANRAALSFGGVQPGDFTRNLKYNKNRIFAFVLAFGEVTAEQYAVAAGAINYGFPVIADTDIPQILPSGICTYEHVISEVPYDDMVEKALEVRGCKVNVTEVPIPAAFGPAFEGERIRKDDVHVQFGGNLSQAFEFVTTVELDQINDGEIEIVGPDIDQIEEGSALPLAIWVEVAGRKMQADFEPVLERQLHHLLNGAEGIWHMGQRDTVWTRVSKAGFARGLRLRHYGDIIHAKLLSDYPAIVDKVKVTLITDEEEVSRRIGFALDVYAERNRRLASMTDESVDTFYSCLLCQSFAPNHVCVITPERTGLCGAYSWLDGRASFEIDETGPNQPVPKGECLDPVRGLWEGVNEYVYTNSHKAVQEFCAYSIMDRPMTSCGCFEVICAYLEECNGVMAVHREFQGDTPVGMAFSTLAGAVGGGQQTPGFIGVGRSFLASKKFLLAEGGHRRLVWMPSELKGQLGEELQQRFADLGSPELFDKIADESVGREPEEVRAFLESVGHPALEMEDMGLFARTEIGDAGARQAETAPAPAEVAEPSAPEAKTPTPTGAGLLGPELVDQIREQVATEVGQQLKSTITREIVQEIIGTLSEKFLGERPRSSTEAAPPQEVEARADPVESSLPEPEAPRAAERLQSISAVPIARSACEVPVWEVKLGATREEGGSRGRVYTVGGATCMPFHLWEGEMRHRPLMAMEVFDAVSEKYPPVLREVYGELLESPAEMARVCVEKYGADLISVRVEGTHPEKGGRSPEQASELVKQVLEAVEVPLIITGHSHFDTVNGVMKEIAAACAGENLLLNWAEQDNYRTIAGAALAYGHCVVAQSPIDVNIAKQINILLTNMDVKQEQIVMDPLTGAMGYGIEYTYSVMERIRLTGLDGDKMLAGPMIVAPGQECAKIKEFRASEADFPSWGELSRRAATWELSSAVSLLYAGADILIMYHPEAAVATKQTIARLMDEAVTRGDS